MFKNIILLSIISLISVNAYAQVSIKGIKNKELRKAIESYNSMEYTLATEQLETYRLNESGSFDDTLALRLLSESYWKIRNYDKAKSNYEKLLSLTKNISSLSKFHISQLNAMNGNYDLAARYILGLNNSKEIISGFLNIPQFLQDSLDYNVTRANSKPNLNKVELSPFIYGDSLFWSMKGPNLPVMSLDNIQKLKTKPSKKLKKSILIEENPSAIYFNPVTLTYLPLTKKVYFTIKNDADDINHLRIAESDIKGNSLKNLYIFSFGAGTYTMINPIISPDGSVLVFLSNIVENQFDLYYCIKNENNWSRPFPLTNINTTEDELFPYFDAESTLYFSSNGRAGLGGLDVYKVKLKVLGGNDIVEHLPYPINTSHDDFHFTTTDDGSTGYLVSDRSGQDDTYFYDYKLKFRKLVGSLQFQDSHLPIIGRKVYLYEKSLVDNGNWIIRDSTASDDDGNYKFKVRPNRFYKTIVQDEVNNITTFVESNDNVQDISLETILLEDLSKIKPVEEVVGKFIINYEFGKSTLTPESKLVLDSLFNYLNNNPTFYSVAASFTDCLGKPEFNLKLSAKRSKEMLNYLLSKGIPLSRIKESHFGNEYLLVPCEQQKFKSSNQSANRRTEIYVTRSNNQSWEKLHMDSSISVPQVDKVTIKETLIKDLPTNTKTDKSIPTNIKTDKSIPFNISEGNSDTKKATVQQPFLSEPKLPVSDIGNSVKESKNDEVKIENKKTIKEPIEKFYSNSIVLPKSNVPTTSDKSVNALEPQRQKIFTYTDNDNKNNGYDPSSNPEVRNFLNKQYSKPVETSNQNIVTPDTYISKNKDVSNYSKSNQSNSGSFNSDEQRRIQQYLSTRDNKKSISVNSFSDSVFIEIYDNGVYDHDTISVIFNNKLVVDRREIGTNVKDPIRLSIKLNDDPLKNQMIIVAENLGTEAPNSALMVISDKLKRKQKIYLTTDMKHNEVVYFINLNLGK